MMEFELLKEFLDEKADLYNRPEFIGTDPIQIPHRFSLKEDIEIAGFLAATIAWGSRKSTIQSALKMMALMGETPYDFVMTADETKLGRLDSFVHRTFNGRDLRTMVLGFRELYRRHGGMEHVFASNVSDNKLHASIHQMRRLMLEIPHEKRFEKHIADPMANAAAKRIHLFLRWMVRRDKRGVDLGIWRTVSPAWLSCPLDVHSARTAREYGLLTRRQDDRKAVDELDAVLRQMDPNDPARYDFALFGLSIEAKNQ